MKLATTIAAVMLLMASATYGQHTYSDGKLLIDTTGDWTGTWNGIESTEVNDMASKTNWVGAVVDGNLDMATNNMTNATLIETVSIQMDTNTVTGFQTTVPGSILTGRVEINSYIAQDPTNGIVHPIECPWADGGTMTALRLRVIGSVTGQVDVVTADWNVIGPATVTMIESNITINATGTSTTSFGGTATLTNTQSYAYVLKNLSEFLTTNVIAITSEITEN